MQSAFLQYMSQANTSLVRQIGTSFELVVSQIDAQIYRFVSYDNGLMQSVQKRKQSISEMIKLYQTLDAAAIGNRYLYSIYLYVPDENRIFASDRGSSYTRDKFFDPTVWPYLESGQTGIVPPRTVVAAASAVQSKMLISTVFPLIGTGGQPSGILVANIDLELLYQDILKSIQVSDNQKVYIYNEEGTIIASPDQKNMFSPIQDVYRKDTDSGLSYWIDAILHRRTVMQSHASSSRLGINFYLWTDIPIQYENIPNLSIWIPGFLILAVTGAVLCYLVIRTSTRPLQEAVFALNEKILRDLLLDTSHGKNSALAQLERLDQKFEYERFLVVLCETPKTDIELWDYGKSVLEEIYPDGKKPLSLRALSIKHGISALIINYSGDQAYKQLTPYLFRLYQRLEQCYAQVWLYSGLPRNSALQLPAAYQDCLLLQEHKLALENHFAIMQELPSDSPIEYPFELEKQILNNLLLGNSDGCFAFLNRFFQMVLAPQSGLSDIQIRNYLYQLQNAILKRISSLPISIRLGDRTNLDDIQTKEGLLECFKNFIQTALEEINRKNSQDETILSQSVFHYIDENLLSENFNLNSISYHFNLNRNYLAEIIREKPGYTFNDYINQKKVAMSKQLLADYSLTIEAVAHQCGFSYAHYFIKIFKSFEGITPGQYRKMLGNNKNAPLS